MMAPLLLTKVENIKDMEIILRDCRITSTLFFGRVVSCSNKKTYSLNEITYQFQKCLKKSPGENSTSIQNLFGKIKCLEESDVDSSFGFKKLLFFVRDKVNNFFFKITHNWFDRKKSLSDIQKLVN